ncbi:MAG: N-acetylmuramoyl-L-alanine amidase [Candidatus Omnitrophota bacterium]|nr:N-acetylmuramoyl-L-alanine amidase [Candidatus Omnitrophota bacterium]MDZ4241372.1 N-acetylmuramoyl-L-alanine amidase [Candidatus Omnitrophota bacterium]
MKRLVRYGCLLLLAAAPFVGGCATAPRPGVQANLKEMCEANGISWQLDSVSQTVTMRKGSKEARALVGSHLVVLDGKTIPLSAPLKIQRSLIIVPPDFKAEIIDRLLAAAPVKTAARMRFQKIVLDAGHGGKDPGAIGRSGLREKDVTLGIVQNLAKKLRGKGFEVVLTRDRDVFLTLEQRTEIATRAQADLFISVHANASPSKNTQGVEVYACRELESKEKKEDQRRRNHQLLFSGLSMEQNSDTLKKILEDMMYSYKRVESYSLASFVASVVSDETRAHNRGRKMAGFFVLRNTLTPAILVEVGYVSHGKEENLLKTDGHREKIAQGLAQSIWEYVSR